MLILYPQKKNYLTYTLFSIRKMKVSNDSRTALVDQVTKFNDGGNRYFQHIFNQK
jgi:hypothetical protein